MRYEGDEEPGGGREGSAVATVPGELSGSAAGAGGAAVSGRSYRAHLDGLRAVAVYLVVVFHARVDRFTGGFIGVDVFFVLSGFLVTQLLLRDLQGRGRVRFGWFYARRFRRLLPASAVALVVTALLFSAVAAPGQAVASVDAFKSAFLYVANWHLIQQSTGYFGADATNSPVVHFWSLAIEEQFYVVWPLLLAGLFALAGRFRWRPVVLVRAVIVVLTVVSLGRALSLQGAHLDRAYYGTDTRFYQLSIGGLLALAPGVMVRARRLGRLVPFLGAVALGGVVVLATSLISIGAITRGAVTAGLVVVILIALEAAPVGWVHRALGSAPFVYLGRISYGTYLWHWPVILVAVSVADPSPLVLSVLAAGIATGLAGLSYQLLEMPIRLSPWLNRHRYAVIATGLAISATSALLVIPHLLDTTADATTAIATPKGFTPLPPNLDLTTVQADGFGTTVDCSDKAPTACTTVRGTGPHILLMGDSNAQMLIPAFTALAQAENLTLSLAVTSGCPWQKDLPAILSRSEAACRENRGDAYDRVIPALKPDIIVLVDIEYRQKALEVTREVAAASLRLLEAPGRTIILVEPIVEAPEEVPPLTCLQRADFVEDCRYVASTQATQVELLYRSIAAQDPSVLAADLDRLACPYLPICDPIIDGVVVRWDSRHLTAKYSASLGDDLAAYLRSNRLLPA